MPDAQQVEVYSPKGKLGTIPPAQLEKAKAAGYKPKDEFVEAVHPKTGKTGIIPRAQWDAAQKQGYTMSPREQQSAKAKSGTGMKEGALEKFMDSPTQKMLEQSNVDAAKFGADALAGGELFKAGKALFSPTTITKAGPLVPGGRSATGQMLPWIRSQVTAKGPSLAKQGVSKVVSGAKGVGEWMKANPVKAVAIEGIAHELGVDPIQLARKVLKYGPGLVP